MSIAKPVVKMARPRPGLRVSFDIDDTLVCEGCVPTEQFVPLWARRRYPEAVRRGCRALMLSLAERGCRIWVYTTSRRSPRYLHGWFRSMGIRLEGVVTLCRHEAVVGYRGPSKYPPAFDIGLHVDDSHGVAQEGQAHGFRVVVVAPGDEHWAARVLATVDDMLDPVPVPQSWPRLDHRPNQEVRPMLSGEDPPR